MFDGWEDHGRDALWAPACDSLSCKDLSTSFVHADQHTNGANECVWYDTQGALQHDTCALPLYRFEATESYSKFKGAGFVLRPGATPIQCGKSGDSGGNCAPRGQPINWCASPSVRELVTATS
eukprot:14230-Prymnesium_polylepis.1